MAPEEGCSSNCTDGSVSSGTEPEDSEPRFEVDTMADYHSSSSTQFLGRVLSDPASRVHRPGVRGAAVRMIISVETAKRPPQQSSTLPGGGTRLSVCLLRKSTYVEENERNHINTERYPR